MPERGRYRHRPMSGQPRGRHSAGPRRSLLRTVLTTGPTLLLQLAVVLALVAGTTAFVRLDKTVTVSIDGRDHQVRGFARTVGDLLDSEGIRLRPGPRPGQPVARLVAVATARPSWCGTAGRCCSPSTARPARCGPPVAQCREALMLLGVRADGAYVSASRSRRINRGGIDARRADAAPPHLPRRRRAARGDDDGHHGAQRARRGRRAAAHPGPRHPPTSAHRRTPSRSSSVTRVDGKRVVEERPIRFDTVKRKSDELYKGETKVLEQGKVGIEARTYRETYLDGSLDSRTLVEQGGRQGPGDRGPARRHQAASRTTRPTADGLNWAALANCESGGNPQAYNPAGPYYGLYQFMESTWHAVGGVGLPTEASAVRADLPGADPLQPQRRRPVAGLRPATCSADAGRMTPDPASALLGPAEVRELAARLGAPADQGARARTSSSTPTPCGASCARPRSAPDDARRRGRARPRLADPRRCCPEVAVGHRRRDRPACWPASCPPPSRGTRRRTPTGSRSSPPTRCGWTRCRARRRPRSWRTCPTTSRCRCCCTCSSGSRRCAGCW